MCWQGKCVMRRAAEDMVAHKIMYRVGNKLYPYYRNDNFTFEYTVGERYKTDVSVIKEKGADRIEMGFHSYSKENHFNKGHNHLLDIDTIFIFSDNAPNVTAVYPEETHPWEIDDVTRVYPDIVLAKCIVPKGACYWINIYGEIVSKEIIVTDEVIMELANRCKPKEV